MDNAADAKGAEPVSYTHLPQHYQRQLLEIFARQASSVVLNRVLRRLLIQKNEELARANDVLRENYTQIISAMRLLVDTKDKMCIRDSCETGG